MSLIAGWLQWLWVANVCAQIGVLYLLVRRGGYKKMPFFSFYLLSDLTRSAVILLIYSLWAFSSGVSIAVAWSSQAVVLVARGLAVAEICKNCLQNYQGIWALGRRILTGVGVLVVSYAGMAALVASLTGGQFWIYAMVVAADRGLELSLASVLLSLLFFARYYGVSISRPFKPLAVGFCFFSCVVVLNNTVLVWLLKRYAVLWTGMEMSCYFLALVLWLRALYKLVPVRTPIPVLVPQGVYEEFAPQINYRLRLLNDRLLGMLKS